jgi:adenylosuccinate lyase
VAIPEAHRHGRALRQARFMLKRLVVDAGRMRRNLDLTGGLIVAEADDGTGQAHGTPRRPRSSTAPAAPPSTRLDALEEV